MMKIGKKKVSDGLKALFVIVGAVVTIGTIAVVLYNVFKKYFKITVECENDDDCFDDFDEYDPVCSPDDCASCAKKEEEEEEDDEEEDDEEEDEDEEEDKE